MCQQTINIKPEVSAPKIVMLGTTNAEQRAGPFSRLTFSYISPVIGRAARQRLETQDLLPPRDVDLASSIHRKFLRSWKLQITTPQPSIWKALKPLIMGLWRGSALMFLLSQLLQFAGPALLFQIVALLEYRKEVCGDTQPGEHCDEDADIAQWGYIFAGLLLVSPLIGALAQYHQQLIMFRISLRARTALVGVVFRKCLRLASLGGESTGQIQNLMANDCQKMVETAPFLNMAWSSPIMIVVAMAALWLSIGPSFLAGIAVMLVGIPIQAKLMITLFKIRPRVLKYTDERVKCMGEVLQGVRVIKLYGWEEAFNQKILALRTEELRLIRKQKILAASFAVFIYSLPTFIAIATFATYAATSEEPLTASVIFTALSLLALLRFPLAFLPFIAIQVLNLLVAFKRITRFLMVDEMDEDILSKAGSPQPPAPTGPTTVSLKGTFLWDLPPMPDLSSGKGKGKGKGRGRGKGEKGEEGENGGGQGRGRGGAPKEGRKEKKERIKKEKEEKEKKEKERKPKKVLSDMDFTAKAGQLTMIVGPVGGGKSSLLAALLGEVEGAEGAQVVCEGRKAYVSQSAWILNDTLRNNVLFGSPFDPVKYQQTLDVCALLPDLEQLPGGDTTEIGEKGITLSGGQKARISMARAVYADAEVLLLDDPLSAVDSHVGRHLFDKVLGPEGLLKDTTRILVTHQTQYLPEADHVVLLDNGAIKAQGTFTELSEAGESLTFVIHKGEGEEEEKKAEEEAEVEEEVRAKSDSVTSDKSKSASFKSKEDTKEKAPPVSGELIADEERESGSISNTVILAWFKAAGGGLFLLLVLLGYSSDQLAKLATDRWLANWISQDATEQQRTRYYLGIYVALGVTYAIAVWLRSAFLMAVVGVRASRKLFQQLLLCITHAPTTFFDTTPSGRILNRFTKDTEEVDNTLTQNMQQMMGCIFTVLGVLTLISVVHPWFGAALVPLFLLYNRVGNYFRHASRDLQRLESVSRSPIFTHFSETISGISTIRAFSHMDRFVQHNEGLVDSNNSCFYTQQVGAQWLSLRLDFLGTSVLFLSGFFAILSREWIDPGLAGLCIAYALEVCQFLKHGTRMMIETERTFNSVERIHQYTTGVPQEAPYTSSSPPPASWPEKGKITLTNFSLIYRAGLEAALRDVSLVVEAGEKVGIVGRTGAGKSSLVTALFRLVEGNNSGSITIDGLDIATLGLAEVRQRLSIIPQDPVLFNDTLRYNLDPFSQYTEEQVWEALELAQLKPLVSGYELQLEHQVAEGGSNLSVGQRQMICLARAILRRSPILVLDEATASIDNDTDALIQTTIRSVFAKCTVLTIAHRLHTIMDSDRVMLLEAGRVAEFDTPASLLALPHSKFSALVADTGAAAPQLRQMALDAQKMKGAAKAVVG